MDAPGESPAPPLPTAVPLPINFARDRPLSPTRTKRNLARSSPWVDPAGITESNGPRKILHVLNNSPGQAHHNLTKAASINSVTT